MIAVTTIGKVADARAAEALEAAVEMMNERAFHAFYHRTATPLRAYVARVLGNVTQADDIVQDAYLRFLRRPPPTDDPQQMRAFLFRIATNLMADHWRRARRERQTTEQAANVPATRAVNVPLRLDLTRVFEQLKPQQRQLMWMAYVEGADHREIAASLGLAERSVRVLLYRARRKLAGLLRLNGHGDGYVE